MFYLCVKLSGSKTKHKEPSLLNGKRMNLFNPLILLRTK